MLVVGAIISQVSFVACVLERKIQYVLRDIRRVTHRRSRFFGIQYLKYFVIATFFRKKNLLPFCNCVSVCLCYL